MMRTLLVFLLLPGLLAAGVTDSPAAVPVKKKQDDRKTLVQRLLNASGARKEKSIMTKMRFGPEMLVDNKMLRALGLSNEHIDIVNSVYKGSYRLNDYYDTRQKGMLQNFNGRHVGRALKFYNSGLGRKAVSLNHKFWKDQKGFKKFVAEINHHAPSSTRLKLVERLVQAKGLLEQYMKNESSIFRTLDPLSPHFQAPDSESLTSTMRSELGERVRSLLMIEDMYRYRSLKNKELQNLVEFHESPEGQWLSRIDNQAYEYFYDKMNRRAAQRLGSLVSVIEAGNQDMDTIKTVFSPGLRYMFSNDRDPFAPLIVKKEKKKKVKVANVPAGASGPQKPSETRFGEELDKIQTIPYELYRRLKKVDPALHADLEYYGTLFKNKKELSALQKTEYQDEVNNYRKLIQKAIEYGDALVKTPLQTELGGLKLSGVLWDGFGTVALVETPDSHGHTVKVGSLVGPNYGVVEAIDQEKMVIVERIRDFQGNIFSVTRFLEFSQSTE